MAKKKTGGRRKPSPEDERTVWVKLQLPVRAHRLLKAAAAMQGLTLNGMVAALIDQYLRPKYEG